MEEEQLRCGCASESHLKQVYAYSVADVLAFARENRRESSVLALLRTVQVSLASLWKQLQSSGGKRASTSSAAQQVRWGCGDVVCAAQELAHVEISDESNATLRQLLVADYLHLLLLTHTQAHSMLRLQAHLCDVDVFSSAVGAVLQALSEVYEQLPSKTLLRLLIRQTWFHVNQIDGYDSPHFTTVLHVLQQLRIRVDDPSQEARFEQYDRSLHSALEAISRVMGMIHRPGLATDNEYDSDDELSDPADVQRSLLEPVLSVVGLFAHMTDAEAEQYLKASDVERTTVRCCLSSDGSYDVL